MSLKQWDQDVTTFRSHRLPCSFTLCTNVPSRLQLNICVSRLYIKHKRSRTGGWGVLSLFLPSPPVSGLQFVWRLPRALWTGWWCWWALDPVCFHLCLWPPDRDPSTLHKKCETVNQCQRTGKMKTYKSHTARDRVNIVNVWLLLWKRKQQTVTVRRYSLRLIFSSYNIPSALLFSFKAPVFCSTLSSM